MGIGDYLENSDAEEIQQAKDDYIAYIVDLEERLDQAEAYGEAGDMNMFAMLEGFDEIDSELQYHSKKANEELPQKDYHATIKKILSENLVGIIAKEIKNIQILEKGEDEEGEINSRIENLDGIIDFYIDLYPELNLSVWKEKLGELKNTP